MPYEDPIRLRIDAPANQKESLSQRAERSCRISKRFEDAGEYEAAREALSEFWPSRDGPPIVQGLERRATAEVLLRAGAVEGWLGAARQDGDAQEKAKDLITQSIAIFEEIGESVRATEARSDISLCYWREGAFDEARVILLQVLSRLGKDNEEAIAVALIRRAIFEKTAGRFGDALRIATEATPLVERLESHTIKGTFYNHLAMILNRLAIAEDREDRIDRALVAYSAASFHFEQAGHHRYRASVENNIGYLFMNLKRFDEAHLHLDCGRRLFQDLNDVGRVAEIDDTRARVLLAQGRLAEAERFARASVKALERGGQHPLLTESLTTHGVVLARLGKHARARANFDRAVEVAQMAGDHEGAGLAKLSIVEELNHQTPAKELASIFHGAVQLLQRSQDPAATKRLIACSHKVIDSFGPLKEETPPEKINWDGFSLKQQILNREKTLIRRALRDSRGVVSQAARLLGLGHHQTLIALINSRHKELVEARSAVRTRRRSILSRQDKPKTPGQST